jgi:hypothetical protein
MPRFINEIPEHDQLILMMANYFRGLGYTEIKADIPDWEKPNFIYWTNIPERKYFPDLTCRDRNGFFVILEAETCSTLNDQHTREQFEIFRAHADQQQGRFEVVVPIICQGRDARTQIRAIAESWNIRIDQIWTPSS